MEINKELVRNIAELSRIKISDAEVAIFEADFKEMFAYFAKIQEIHDSKTTENAKEKTIKLREDIPTKKDEQDETNRIIENFNQKEGRLMIAPKTL